VILLLQKIKYHVFKRKAYDLKAFMGEKWGYIERIIIFFYYFLKK